jgi:hypothetical protein
MLQTYRTRLLGACIVFSRDPLDICQLTEAQRWLRKVDGVLNEGGEMESARGLYGPNGHGPAIDLLCRQAEAVRAFPASRVGLPPLRGGAGSRLQHSRHP